jgi:exonuclease SbcD
MADDLRVLHVADSHIGAQLPARPRLHRPRRGDDFVDSFRSVLSHAIDGGVDLIIHAGDVFDSPSPSGRAMFEAGQPLLDVASSGVPVLIVPGNHERSAIPASLLLAHPNIHIASAPGTWSFDIKGIRVCVAALPCLRRRSAERFPEALSATAWHQRQSDVNILAVHQTFESATCGRGDFRFRSGEDVIERNAIPGGIDYVAAGHVHRHQVLDARDPAGPPIVYAGSPDRISFAEKDEPKGCVIVSFNGKGPEHTFVEHDVRPMCIVPLDVTGLPRRRIVEEALARIEALPPEAVAALRLTGRSTREEMRGLSLTKVAAERRPDVLLTASAEAVVYHPPGSRRRRRTERPVSAFECLNSFTGNVTSASAESLRSLPKDRAVYVLYDATGRLLYVGKAKNVRARVQSHVRGHQRGGRLAGWQKDIATVEVRPVDSELEALLLEAELVRRLRPPFNRRMRSWARYCYVCTNNRPFDSLEVTTQPLRDMKCFGPWRSRFTGTMLVEGAARLFGTAACPAGQEKEGRLFPLLETSAGKLCHRYFDGLCCAPCAGRAPAAAYEERLSARDRFLSGVDDTALAAREAENAIRAAEDPDAPKIIEETRWLEGLRAAFEFAKLLREAETLLGSLIILPPCEQIRTIAAFTLEGVQFFAVGPRSEKPVALAARLRSLATRTLRNRPVRLPRPLVDTLCTAIQEMRRRPTDYRPVPADRARRLRTRELLRLARSG